MAEPSITTRAYHTSSGSNLPVTRVVIHTTEPNMGFPRSSESGQAHSIAEYFTSPSSGGSAHYVVDVQNEEHCVPENTIAWHAPPNQGSIGIEVCGQAAYSNAEWRSTTLQPLLNRVAARTADLCHRYNIPVVKLSPQDLLAGRHGICGHRDVTDAWHQSDHQDPGPDFPWAEFLGLVHDHLGSTPPQAQNHPGVPQWPGRVLSLGAHGDDVMTWQHGLVNHHGATLKVDGQYGPQSVAACRVLQENNHLHVDGKVGPQTWAVTFK